MKKVIGCLILCLLTLQVLAAQENLSKEYLQSHRHFSPMNPLVEMVVEHQIKSSLKKQTGGRYKVKFDGYTTSSMKQGVFKYLDVTGKNIKDGDVEIPYIRFKSISDYNYIDYTQTPMVFKSNMKFSYELHLDENSINTALQSKKYNSVISSVNRYVYPLLVIKDVRAKIEDNKLYVLMDYNLPVMRFPQDKTFIMTADFYVENSQIKPRNIKMENYYVKIPLNKVTSILNILNPLDFTMDLLESKKCKGSIENINIEDDIITIDGRIFVKSDVNR